MAPRRKEILVAQSTVDPEIELDSLGIGDRIEIQQEMSMTDLELEDFMNQVLIINVFSDSREGALQIIAPSVNGKRQPIVRNRPTKVKRKYVEVLARSVFTTYDQRRRDPMDPGSITLVPTTTQSYAFSILHDPDPRGKAWLEMVMQQPVEEI